MKWEDIYLAQKVDLNIEGVLCPNEEDVFAALNYCNFDDVKVCIIGQDPYHTLVNGVPIANGLAFSVNKGVRIPPSLQNIYKEIESDLGIAPPEHGDLTSWATEGVLLLNSILTTEAGKPLLHEGKGWEYITGKIIACLAYREDPVVFMLWGRKAQETFTNNVSPEHTAFILESVHPSPLSANKGFFGCKHFSKANEILTRLGKDPINWRIE